MRIHRIALASLMSLALIPPAQAGVKDTLDFGGQFRLRAESRSPSANYASMRGQDMLLFRTRLWGQAEPAEGVRAYLQLQHAHTGGSNTPADTDNGVGLHQGYFDVLELWGQPLSLRAGRQVLSYGDQRLISPLAWSNVGRTWDGVRLRADGEAWRVDLLALVLEETGRNARHDDILTGLYATCRAVSDHEFDLYALGRDSGAGSVNGDRSQRTLGTRAKGKTGPADYSGEAAFQFGRQSGAALRAWAAAATGGYTMDAPWKPRVGAGYDFASGDKDPDDSKIQTFDPLFPFGHALQGYADLFSWKNGHAIKGSVSAHPHEDWKVQADFHHFRLARSRDAWYNAGAGQIARDTAGASGRTVGNEIDLHCKTSVRDVIKLWFGYSHFFPGNFAKSQGLGEDMDWVFLQAVLDF